MCHLCIEGRKIDHEAARKSLFALKGKRKLPSSNNINQMFLDIFGHEDIAVWLGSSISSMTQLKMKLKEISM